MKRKTQIISLVILFSLSVNSIFSQSKIKNMLYSYLEGTNIVVNDFFQNIVVISIVNTQNLPELEKLNSLAKKYESTTISFIAVTDEISKIEETKLLRSKLTAYEFLPKKENDFIFNTYQTGMYKVFPMQVVLNSKGYVSFKKKGKTKNIEEKMSKKINTLIKMDSFLIQKKGK